jgi:hypothetical protein
VTISSTSAHVILSSLTIQNGLLTAIAAFGGGIHNVGTLTINNSTLSANSVVGTTGVAGAFGGGIYNGGGAVTIKDSTLSGNSATNSIGVASGGGIYNGGGTVTINSSTLSENIAPQGGGIDNFSGTLTINNSTLGENSAFGLGGGVLNGGNGTLTISNSTLSENSAIDFGGDIYNLGVATLQNSIVANSSFGGNCLGPVISKGYNLSSDGTCNFTNTGDLNSTDPKLGPLQNNGGQTQTQALLPGSPAIDAGNPNGCTDNTGHLLKTDQRGKPRPDKEDSGGCDMGAYERQGD